MGLIPKNLAKEIKKKYSTINKEAGETVCLYMEPNKSNCPNCLSDTQNDSLGIFDTTFVAPVEIFGTTYEPVQFNRGRCPICYGSGSIEQEVKKQITCVVRWNPTNDGDMDITQAGKEGLNIVSIKAIKCYYDNVRDCIKAKISGIDCALLNPPVLRHVGLTDITAVAYFVSIDTGHSSNQ